MSIHSWCLLDEAKPSMRSQALATLERMIEKRPQADRLIVAELTGEARHRAR